MRAALFGKCVLAALLAANFAGAQSLRQASELEPALLPEVNFEFGLASLAQESAAQGATPDSSSPGIVDPLAGPQDNTDPSADETSSDESLSEETLSDESFSDDFSPCPRCHCLCCKCPETAHPCEECPRVNNINPAWGLMIGGTISLDALYNSSRPVAPGTPFFLTPRAPFDDDTFDIHARETSIYLAANGPRIGRFESGGLIMFALYNDSITVDRYGFLPYQAYGELKNEQWRFAGGLQMDIFAPVLPTVLPFSFLAASGNAGIYRGQLRAERFYRMGSNEQVTLTVGISDPNPTLLNNDILSEDNGWPNVEGRAAWAVGPLKQEGLLALRPFEVGVSGVVGQMRSTDLGPLTRVVADVWGVAADFRWRVSENWGLQGEVFTGQGLGTYGGGVLQSVNSVTFEAIEATGGWLEVYFYCNPCVHTHWGYGIDNPLDADLAPTQIARNDTIFANLIWDVTRSFRLASELTYRSTDWLALPDNQGFGYHWQMQWKF
jgi:hypothetical protein